MELWRSVLQEALTFRQDEPWLWMKDADASVYLDGAGNSWVACVLGNAGQVYGLCLYRGEGGLRLFRQMSSASPLSDPARFEYSHDAITVWFGPKKDLDEVQVDRYRKLGYTGRKGDRMAWPDVRSHRPGYFAWHPEESEVKALAEALPQVLGFARLFRTRLDVYNFHGEDDLPLLPASGQPVSWKTVEWRTWATPAETEVGPALAVDEGSGDFRALAGLPMSHELELECDLRFMPEPVTDGGRPYYPRGACVLRGTDAFCCGMELLRPNDDAVAVAAAVLTKAMRQLGTRARRIAVARQDLWKRLLPWAQALNIELQQQRRLPAVETMWTALEEYHSRGSRRRR